MADEPQSYFQKRMQLLGITDDVNTFEVPYINITTDNETEELVYHADPDKFIYKRTVFEADDKDNIRIYYYDLTGRHYEYRGENERSWKKYFRTRLKNPREYTSEDGKKELMKYVQSKGSGHYPFFPPSIINKFLSATLKPSKALKKNSEKNPDIGFIDTLFVVEGELKAFKGSLAGIDIIGIPSIHGFYASDIPGKLHEDIQRLIITCQVKKIVYLTDADTLAINWEEGKDLKKRANTFYSAVKNFRNSLQLLLDTEESQVPLQLVYFMHLRTDLMEGSKGLDDLLCNLPKKESEIRSDLLQLDLSKTYFSGRNITDNRYSNSLYTYFGLNNVEKFYETYKKFIGSREFRWGKSRFQWDGEEVVHNRHEDADQYFRVGSDWMKIIRVPNKFGELEEEIIPYKISEITRDYKKFPDFIDQLQRFDAFCNIPDWTEGYRRKHIECYNVCNPINWRAKEGSICTTISYLKHLFGGSGTVKEYPGKEGTFSFVECAALGDQFTVALDWLTLIHKLPMHRLPVPILVSPEQGTGKSTFLKWLRAIYGSNATILDNDRFKMNFNAHYITKFIIGVDEGFLDIEKKAEKEKLKQIATADEAFLENKGMNLKKFAYYGKLIICSNDADKVMQMDLEDRRWFVVRVPKLVEQNPNLEVQLRREIPAWLHFLENREIYHPRETDMWFKTEYIITSQFKKVVEVTKSRLDKVIESYLEDMFLTYRMPVLRLDLKTILESVNDPKISKYKIDEKDLTYFLKERKGMERQELQRLKIPYGFDLETGITLTTSKAGRPFEFRYEEWLTPAQEKEFHSKHEFQLPLDSKPAPVPIEDLPF